MRGKTVRRVGVAAFAAVAALIFLAALFPTAFFDTKVLPGQHVKTLAVPKISSILTMLGILVGAFSVAFLGLVKTARPHLLSTLIIVLGAQGVAYAGYSLWEFHETPLFCVRTCHVMEPTYVSYAEPGVNLMMLNHTKNNTARCLDCHTGPGITGQVQLGLTSMRHVWKYSTGDFDPNKLGGKDAVKTVPDANCLKCHGPGKPGKLPDKHDRFDTRCALCHDPHKSNASGYFFPGIILEKKDCTYCHKTIRDDFRDHPSKHGEIADQDCRTCHTSHGTKRGEQAKGPIKGCTDAGCHDQDAANPESLPRLKHAAFDGVASCSACHGTRAHNLTRPTLDDLKPACKTCHTDKVVPDQSPHAGKPGTPQGCTDCHGAEPRGVAKGLSAHGDFDCVRCHRPGNTVNAPVVQWSAAPQSELSWQRQNNKNFANWTTVGRGTHDPSLDCGECHQLHKSGKVAYPEPPPGKNESCNTTCHTWLGNVYQPGFESRAANTLYNGSIEPFYLLNYTFDPNGNGKHHKSIYETFGCTGFCHNPGMTLEIAKAWVSSGTKPGLPKGDEHGFVAKCTTCHQYKSPAGGPDDLHTTHASLVGAEQPVYNPGNLGQPACNYCHSSGPYPAAPAGGCYQCHLSGHRPQTYYWNGGSG